jgi:hypothetical protein
MSTTVLEALKNAQTNFETLGNQGLKRNPIFAIAISQLTNGVLALENGRAPDFVIQENMASDVAL